MWYKAITTCSHNNAPPTRNHWPKLKDLIFLTWNLFLFNQSEDSLPIRGRTHSLLSPDWLHRPEPEREDVKPVVWYFWSLKQEVLFFMDQHFKVKQVYIYWCDWLPLLWWTIVETLVFGSGNLVSEEVGKSDYKYLRKMKTLLKVIYWSMNVLLLEWKQRSLEM